MKAFIRLSLFVLATTLEAGQGGSVAAVAAPPAPIPKQPFDPDAYLKATEQSPAKKKADPYQGIGVGVASKPPPWSPPELDLQPVVSTNQSAGKYELMSPVELLEICVPILACLACWWWVFATLRSDRGLDFPKAAGVTISGVALLCLTFPLLPESYGSTRIRPEFFVSAGDNAKTNWSWTIHGFLWLSFAYVGVLWALKACAVWLANRRKVARLGTVTFVGRAVVPAATFAIPTVIVAVTASVLALWARKL